jgi:glutamate/tyrosine decarboxylase-like PLP-dependent enzyme
MHRYDTEIDAFADEVFVFARHRASLDGATLGMPRRRAELDAAAGPSITAAGIGPRETLRRFTEVLEPACLSSDFPRYLAFVPTAPSEVSILADLVVSACSIYAGSWMEGAGAVWAENEALRWLADLAGLPPEAGGCFVVGGTAGNLSALVAARAAAARALAASGVDRPDRWAIICAGSAHSSVEVAADVMDADIVAVASERLTGAALAPVLAEVGRRACAVVATAGTTNLGRLDDLAGVAEACAAAGVWFHVDGAYGGAALAAPSVRRRFDGIERADSLIIDPHKWLFAPFDACALLYRDPDGAKACHAQHASYLDVLSEQQDWNPSDYAVHLTRRARGLPLWFSLAAHGTAAYAEAVETCLATARAGAELIRRAVHLELVCEPELSVVAFRRTGWDEADYRAWSEGLLRRGEAFVVPSKHEGRPMVRMCVVNPRTTVDDLAVVIDSMR